MPILNQGIQSIYVRSLTNINLFNIIIENWVLLRGRNLGLCLDSNPGSNLGPPIIPWINTLITQLLFEFAVNIQFRIEKMNVLHRKNVHCYYKQLIFRFTHDRNRNPTNQNKNRNVILTAPGLYLNTIRILHTMNFLIAHLHDNCNTIASKLRLRIGSAPTNLKIFIFKSKL